MIQLCSKLLVSFFIISSLISCSNTEGTSTGNPLTGVGFSMTGSSDAANLSAKIESSLWSLLFPQAKAFPPPPILTDGDSNQISLSSFWINVSNIELKTTQTVQPGETTSENPDFKGPFAVNLFNSSPASLDLKTTTLLEFRRIKFQTVKTTSIPAGAPSGFLNSSIYISGQIGGHQITFSSDENLNLSLAGSNLISVRNGENILLKVRTADLIKEIKLSVVVSDINITRQNPVLAAAACPAIDLFALDLYTCFIKGLSQQIKAGRDINRDHILGSADDILN